MRYVEGPDGELIQRQTNPGIQVQGQRNMAASIDIAVREQLRVGRQVLERSDVNYYLQLDPGRRLSRIGVNGSLGDAIDFAHGRVSTRGNFSLFGTIKPPTIWRSISTPTASGSTSMPAVAWRGVSSPPRSSA